jgi:hypothetical protein
MENPKELAKKKKSWEHGSRGRALALQERGPKFKPSTANKQTNKNPLGTNKLAIVRL